MLETQLGTHAGRAVVADARIYIGWVQCEALLPRWLR